MVLEEESYGKKYILRAVQVTYQKKRLRDTLKIRNRQTAYEEALFPLFFMKQVCVCHRPALSFHILKTDDCNVVVRKPLF